MAEGPHRCGRYVIWTLTLALAPILTLSLSVALTTTKSIQWQRDLTAVAGTLF